MSVLGLDIGGAGLKAADSHTQRAVSLPFPLWQRPNELAPALKQLIGEFTACSRIAVTMTGELADCYRTKREGVQRIVAAAEEAAAGTPLHFYTTDGAWLTAEDAVAADLKVAAANWHALARFAGRYLREPVGLLIDIGSTTTDIIPLLNGYPATVGKTDPERLLARELVYTGVQRTFVCDLVRTLPWRGEQCPVAAELFATVWDAYLVCGLMPEEPEATHTADGRPATIEFARERLARCICADIEMYDEADLQAAARQIVAAQQQRVAAALRTVVNRQSNPPRELIFSGQGEFLARRAAEAEGLPLAAISLAEQLGPERSRAAPAVAVATLAAEHFAK